MNEEDFAELKKGLEELLLLLRNQAADLRSHGKRND